MSGLSFQDATKIIRENPKEADALAFASQEYFKTHTEESPSDIPESVLNGKVISETYDYLRDQHEDSQMRKEGEIDQLKIPQDLASTVILAAAFYRKPKIIEDDRQYQKIENNLTKEWLEKNPGKDLSSMEGIDYVYGALDDRTKTSLHKEAEEAFRNNPRFKDRVEKYSKEAKKIYKNRKADPKVQLFERNAQREIEARLELQEKTRNKQIKISKEDFKKSQDKIIGQVNRKYLREFAQNYREKTDVYHEKVKAERAGLKNQPRSRPEANIFTRGSSLSIQASMGDQESQASNPSGEGIGQELTSRLKNRVLNKLLKKQAGKQAGKVAAQAAKKFAIQAGSKLLMNPYVLGAIGAIILIAVITFFIVSSTGKDKYGTQQNVNAPTMSPAEL
jgi:hypothetical protein